MKEDEQTKVSFSCSWLFFPLLSFVPAGLTIGLPLTVGVEIVVHRINRSCAIAWREFLKNTLRHQLLHFSWQAACRPCQWQVVTHHHHHYLRLIDLSSSPLSSWTFLSLSSFPSSQVCSSQRDWPTASLPDRAPWLTPLTTQKNFFPKGTSVVTQALVLVWPLLSPPISRQYKSGLVYEQHWLPSWTKPFEMWPPILGPASNSAVKSREFNANKPWKGLTARSRNWNR